MYSIATALCTTRCSSRNLLVLWDLTIIASVYHNGTARRRIERTVCPLICPVNRLSRSIIISSQASIWYRGGCGFDSSFTTIHAYGHSVHVPSPGSVLAWRCSAACRPHRT